MVQIEIPEDKVDQYISNFKTILGTLLAQEIIKRAPSNTSNLRQRTWYKIKDSGVEITLPEYAIYVEYGTPGVKSGKSSTVGNSTTSFGPKADRKMPLIKEGDEFKLIPELADWVKKRGGDPKNWWPLAKHIQQYGTEPHPFIRPALFLEFNNIVETAAVKAAGGL